jgi:hypothetical protein
MPPIEVDTPPLVIAVAAMPQAADPLRIARQQMQRSVLTNSLLSRVLSCGGDLPSYERVLRTFIWTPTADGR